MKRDFQFKCPLCQKPMRIRRGMPININTMRSELHCTQCNIGLKEAYQQKLKIRIHHVNIC